MKLHSDRLRLEIQRSRVPFLVVALTGGLALVVTLLMLTHQVFKAPWKDYYEVKVAFDDVKGATPGKEPVRISGVPVGLVSDWAVKDGRAVLTLSIERKYAPLYRNARVRQRPITPLQDMYIDIDRGTPRAGAVPDGATIPAGQAQTPVDISRVLQAFDPDTRARLRTMLGEFGSGLRDNGARLRAAFAELGPFLTAARDVTDAMGARRQALARLVHNFGGVTDALARRDGQIRRLILAGNGTLAELARNDAPFARTLAELPPTLGAMRGGLATLRASESELDPALHSLVPVADHLPSGLAALTRFSGDAMPALRALEPAVRAARPLVGALRPTSRSLASAFTDLRPQAPSYDRITARFVPCLTAMEHFITWTQSILKTGDAWGANPRADVSYGADSLDGTARDPNLAVQRTCADAPTGGGR